VRTFCKDCKETYHPTTEEYDSLVRTYDGDFDALGFPYKNDLLLYRPKGCSKCGNSGYRGRTGIHEILIGTEPLKSLIQGRAKMEEIRAQAIQDGMTTLMQDGIRKVLLGLTDLLQVRKSVSNEEQAQGERLKRRGKAKTLFCFQPQAVSLSPQFLCFCFDLVPLAFGRMPFLWILPWSQRPAVSSSPKRIFIF